MFAKITLAVLAAFTSVVLGSPLLPRQTCKPNFEGNAQTIFRSPGRNTFNEWTPQLPIANGGHVTVLSRYYEDAYAFGEFFVPFTGTSSGTYQFKAAADSARAFALAGSANGDLSFKPISFNFPNNQEFSISCAACPEPGTVAQHKFAEGCTITHVATGKCVTGIAHGVTLRLETCNGSNEQTYTFTSGPAA